MVVCGLLLFAGRLLLPTQAALADPDVSANETSGLEALLPDIETIYRQSLTTPFEMAEKKIYDPDIAEYYRALMNKTGLVPDDAR